MASARLSLYFFYIRGSGTRERRKKGRRIVNHDPGAPYSLNLILNKLITKNKSNDEES